MTWVIYATRKRLTQLTQNGIQRGSMARGVMGHLGHLAIGKKSPAYNIVYTYCIHFTLLSIYTTHDLNDLNHSISLERRIGQTRQNRHPTHDPIDP